MSDQPTWLNWLVIGGSWLVSLLHPIALLVTIVWGSIQIYSWIVNRGWRRKER